MRKHSREVVLALVGMTICLAGWVEARPQSPPKLPFPGPHPALSPYAKHVLSLNPVGYWRLGESKGPTAFDSSRHKHNGVYHGKLAFHQLGALKNDPDRAIGLRGKSYVQIAAS